MDEKIVLYDRRQLVLMKESITRLLESDYSYRKLVHFVDNVLALAEYTQGASIEWKRSVAKNANAIDVICGMMSLEGKQFADQEDCDAIRNEYLKNIIALIAQYEQELPDIIDESLIDE